MKAKLEILENSPEELRKFLGEFDEFKAKREAEQNEKEK